MILNIKNLGPIKRAKIDLSKSILFFVGYNNSGKTYLSQLIWGVYNEYFHKKFVEEIDTVEILAIDNLKSFEITEEAIDRLIKSYSSFIGTNINLIFKSEKKYFKNFTIELLLTKEVNELITKDLKISFTNALNKDDIINISTESNNNFLEINSSNTDLENVSKRITHFLLIMLFEGKPFYLPSVRGAYTTFYEYIYKIEKEKKDEIDNFFLSNERDIRKLLKIAKQSQPSYTMPMNELISKMIDLKQNISINHDYIEFQQELEQMLGGDIKIHQYPLSKKELRLHIDENINLPMYLSSSNTNQLTTLYLYFKYWIDLSKSNFLILDEPEENLHPKNQYKLMSILIDFVARNNKILITTHSTLMAKIINNYITFSMLRHEQQKEIETKYLNKNILKDDIEVCFFDGEQVKQYSVEEYGVLFKDFVEIESEIESLSNEINIKLYKGN